MRNLHIAFATIALIALGAPSSFAADVDATAAQTQQAAPAATATPVAAPAATDTAAKDSNAIVCKRMSPETGTRLGSRSVCKTQAEWDAISRDSESAMRDVQQRNSGSYVKPAGVSGH